MPTDTKTLNTTLRRQLRRQRLMLSKRQRTYLAYQSLRHLTPITRRFSHNVSRRIKVGVYLDAFGELAIQPLIDWAFELGWEVYLPVVRKANQPLVFVRMNKKNRHQLRLVRHRFGMQQPYACHYLTACELDVVFLPLVAFDSFGYRMGMGGGFYDRSLARAKRTLKIGYAYDFQQVEKLAVNPWDVRLDMALTPSKLHRFSRYLLPKSAFDEALTEYESDELSELLISQIMSVERLEQLLAQANAFGFVNSESLDDF